MQQRGSRNRSTAHPALRQMPLDQLARVLADHRAWLDSNGQSGKKADLSHAQLQGLSMWSADLREADLGYAGLQRAKLDHADLSDANLHNADLTGASLWGAQLSGARLEHVVGITEEQLKNTHRA